MTIFESEVKVFINCHEPIWTSLISILKFIFENLILLRDGCINTNEVIWLYEESVGIDKWLKSCGDRYSMVMIIFMA